MNRLLAPAAALVALLAGCGEDALQPETSIQQTSTTSEGQVIAHMLEPDGCEAVAVSFSSDSTFSIDASRDHEYSDYALDGVRAALLPVVDDDGIVAVVQYPGSVPVGDSGDLLVVVDSEVRGVIVPNVFHTPSPWRLMYQLEAAEYPCDHITVFTSGGDSDLLGSIAEDLAILRP